MQLFSEQDLFFWQVLIYITVVVFLNQHVLKQGDVPSCVFTPKECDVMTKYKISGC